MDVQLLVSPTGIEPVFSASYHYSFRCRTNVCGLDYAFALGFEALRREPSSLYTFPIGAWLGVVTG